MKQFPNVLFITSCCFSDYESNGKTLEDIFSFYPKENLAQFFIKHFHPDWNFCERYFKVTDKEMLECFFKSSGGELKHPNIPVKQATPQNGKRIRKDAFRLIVRQFLWNSKVWMRRTKFKSWVEKVKPNVVLYMVGENPCMMNVAMEVARWRKIPLIVFNTEGYYFSEKNYFATSSFLGNISYPWYKRMYKRGFERLMSQTSYVLYSCPKLQKDYGAYFDLPSDILYTSSTIKVCDYKPKNNADELVVSYLGTLTLGRQKPLIEIGNIIHEYNPNLKLRVYGRADDSVAEELRSSEGIEYRGPIPYSQVVREIENSDILVHAESIDPLFQDLIRYGFTTKIADSLMSGRCFFVYAPEYVACYDYIKSINPECAASNAQEMSNKITTLLKSSELRMQCIDNYKRYAQQNHHPFVNEQKIKRVLTTVTKNVIND